MAFYRYSAAYPTKDGRTTIRSVTPFSPETEKAESYTHNLYTSEKDDSSYYYVISIGHEKGTPGAHTAPRSVGRYIIHYVVNGKGFFNEKPVEKGQFFVAYPYDSHTISCDAESPMEFYYIGLAGPGSEELMARSGFFSIPRIHPFRFQAQIPDLFYDALYTLHTDSDTELYLLSLLMRLLSLHRNENVKTASEHSKMDAFLYYKEALIFVENYLLENITPKDVANHLHISPSYLRLVFSRYCKYSLRELLVRKRMECAASYLAFENNSVAQAAARVGYSDYTLFSKLFKKYTGFSPFAYKNSHRKLQILPENVNLQ